VSFFAKTNRVRLPIKLKSPLSEPKIDLRENALQLVDGETAHAASHLGRSLVLLPAAVL